MWKPGQIVTICGKKYRIKKAPYNALPCEKCNIRDPFPEHEPCLTCFSNSKMPDYSYLEEIKPKSVMG